MAAAAGMSDAVEEQDAGHKDDDEIRREADAGRAAKDTPNKSEESPSESKQAGKITLLSAEAPVFVPGGSTAPADGVAGQDGADDSDVRARLSPNHQLMLRQGYHTMTGEWVAYHVGRLKTYNTRTGYGFIECAQSYTNYGADVFIHKNSMMNPWHIGQPVEFAVVINGKGQPQATDVNWLPRSPAMPTSSSVTSPVPPHRNERTPGVTSPVPPHRNE